MCDQSRHLGQQRANAAGIFMTWMRLIWVGRFLVGAGVLLIGAHLLLAYGGLSMSINFGEAEELQFFLVPIWQIGLAVAATGAAMIMVARVFNGSSDSAVD